MKKLANISQFESLMNGAVNNGALYDKVQSAARAVVPSLLLSYPLVCGGLAASGMLKHHAQEKARITQQAPKPTAGNPGDHIITDINGNMVRKYNVYDVPGEGNVGAIDGDKDRLVNNFRQLLYNDGGIWKSDGWHSINEVPPVDPDDGWNDMRRTDPEEFVRCGLVSPDDGKNWLRLANPERFEVTEMVKKRNELTKKKDQYKQQKRRDEIQKMIDELDFYIEGYLAKGKIPYNVDDYAPEKKLLETGVDKTEEEPLKSKEPDMPGEPETPEEPGIPEIAEGDPEGAGIEE